MRSKKIIISAAIIIILAALLVLVPKSGTVSYSDKYEEYDLNADIEGIGRSNTYVKYLNAHAEAKMSEVDIPVIITDYRNVKNVQTLQSYEGEENVVMLEEDSYAEWEINVPETGMYQFYIEYYPVKSRGIDIERTLYINGEVPFSGADTLTFTRFWTDSAEVKKDNQGNDIRPSQTEAPKWADSYFKDFRGYETEPYLFYLEAGKNTIALEAMSEPMAVKSLSLKAVRQSADYESYTNNSPKVNPTEEAANYKQVVQGEDSSLRSDPSLYASYDRSASNTVPYSVTKKLLNMTGGNAWRVNGQWIEWDFSVPADGYYSITVKGRQNYQRGFVSCRTLYIDGEVPFEEVNSFGFQYNNEWESITIGDDDGNPYQFYLTEGTHSVRLEVTLGEMGNILNDLEDSVYRLNNIYRKILVLTGTNPDRYRDYNIAGVYPEVITGMDMEYKRLYKIIDDVVAYTGQKSSQIAVAETTAVQLEKFVSNPNKIHVSLTNFRDNISSLGTSMLAMSEGALDIDYITITGVNAKPDKVNETFVNKAFHEIRSFIASFTVDYNAIGDVYADDEVIEVWILSGRDQSTILKSMIDDTFTPETGIKVNLKLVEPATMLNAVIAGNGPDVALSVVQGEPVNYALRGAVEDLTQFEDYEEVFSNYYQSAYNSYIFEGGIYAIPETQNFSVLFYRTDILESLGLDVPQTWDDLINMLPAIQQNNMTVAIPSIDKDTNLSGFFAMLYQNGGTLYEDSGKYTLIDEESGVKAFETFTKLFAQYDLPTIYDFPNRFRSGEMPIGIQDFNVFNTLSVFAPEIKGLWDFALIPGTLQEDGTLDRSCHSWGVCSMMLKQEDEAIKSMSWEFMKWWAETDTQVRFGREMESVMGAAARYATANVNAFEQLAWSSSQMEVLSEQWQWTRGVREIAGGYYTSRHIVNAIRRVTIKKEDSRETLLDYSRTINEEIEKKRKEFGLELR